MWGLCGEFGYRPLVWVRSEGGCVCLICVSVYACIRPTGFFVCVLLVRDCLYIIIIICPCVSTMPFCQTTTALGVCGCGLW